MKFSYMSGASACFVARTSLVGALSCSPLLQQLAGSSDLPAHTAPCTTPLFDFLLEKAIFVVMQRNAATRCNVLRGA